MDTHSEEADIELTRLAEQIQKKWKVPSKTMHFILDTLAKYYEIRDIAEKQLEGK